MVEKRVISIETFIAAECGTNKEIKRIFYRLPVIPARKMEMRSNRRINAYYYIDELAPALEQYIKVAKSEHTRAICRRMLDLCQ